MIAGFIGGALVVALVGLIVLAARDVPDRPVGGGERPGGDEQWGAADWRSTVPNIRRLADQERLADQDLAWHPPSRDAPVPARFLGRFPLRAPGSLFAHDTTTGGRHRRPDPAEPAR